MTTTSFSKTNLLVRCGQILFLIVSFFGFAAHAGVLSLSWKASPTATVVGYLISYGSSAGSYSGTLDAGNNLSASITNLQEGTTYFFSVRAYDAAGNKSAFSNEVSATMAAAASADFSVSSTSIDASNTLTLTPATTTSVASWKWDFGDGSTPLTGSNCVVPQATKSYSTAGSYTASLTVGSSVTSKAISVLPVAGFSASSTSGIAPAAISFTDTSVGSPSSWNWSFGDGTSSSERNPAHTFAAAGSYTVSLSVAGGGKQSSVAATKTVSVSAAPSATVPTATLMAAYSLDETKGTLVADASGNGNTGTLVNAPVWTSGKFGSALGFGSGQYVTVPNSPTTDIGGTGLTISFYANITDYGRDQVLISKPWNTSFSYPYYQYGVEFDAQTQSMVFYLGDSNGKYHEYFMAAPLGVWSNVVFTYDGSYAKGYVSGILKLSVADAFIIPTKGVPLRFGLDQAGGQPTNGVLDEIRLYNGALSAAEIAANVAKAVSVTNPPKNLGGSQSVGAVVYSLPMGVAKAFQITPAKDGLVTSLPFYVDTGSSSTKVTVALYSDLNGHPNLRLASGSVSNVVAGKWNSVPVAATAVKAGSDYWLAILNPKSSSAPVIYLRDVSTISGGVIETGGSSGLTSLPSTWKRGSQVYDGPLSYYGGGY